MVAATRCLWLNMQMKGDPRVDSMLRSDLEVFFISALILYLELLLIRWIGTEIRIFAYLGNLILIMCFFGVGLGCYRAAKPVQPVLMAAILLLLATLVANPFHIPELDFSKVSFLLSRFEDSVVAEDVHAAGLGFMAGGLFIGVLICLVTLTFAPLGQILGRAMQRAPHIIRAYSVNIAGSLAGVWLFNGLSWASTPPVVWMLVAAALLAATLLTGKFRAWLAVGLVAAAAWVVWSGDLSEGMVLWSPYQKVAIFPIMVDQELRGYVVQVNGTDHQTIYDLSDRFLASHPGMFTQERWD